MELKLKIAFLALLSFTLSGCSKDFPVMVECHRADGLLAFYGPAERVSFQNIGYSKEPYWVVDNAEGFLGVNTYIPADCTCVATERISK